MGQYSTIYSENTCNLQITCHNIENRNKQYEGKGVFMDIMAIAAASINISAAQTQQAVQTAVLKKTMDAQEAQGEQMVQTLRELPNPARLLDIKI